MPAWATVVLVVAAALLALGYWTYRQVETSLRGMRADTMKSLLDSEVNALRVWIAEERADAERIARDPRVREAIVQLARAPRCAPASRAQLEAAVRPLLRDVGDATFNVVDRDGRLAATCARGGVDRDGLIRLMVGREGGDLCRAQL